MFISKFVIVLNKFIIKSCLIGLLSNINCHENWYSRKPGLILLSSLSKSEIELVAYRSKTNLLNEDIS